MSNENFTQGDWKLEKGDVFNDGIHITSESRNGMIPIVEIKYAYLDDEHKSEIELEQLANAHLIAAAPEMYKLLKKFMPCDEDGNGPFVYSEGSEYLGKAVTELLEKSRGE